tara:strand:+ start:315 stop:533 length:219 start_codon:yes stop_codon:yes gene_type:complete
MMDEKKKTKDELRKEIENLTNMLEEKNGELSKFADAHGQLIATLQKQNAMLAQYEATINALSLRLVEGRTQQ